MKLRIISLITIFLILFSLNTYALSNDKTLEVRLLPSSDSVTRNESFEYGVYIKNSEIQNIATFRLKVSFDNQKFQCKGIEAGEDTDTSQFKYNIQQGLITIIYLSENSPYIISQDNTSSPMFSIKFKSLSDAPTGQGNFGVKIDGMANDDIEPLGLNLISIDSINIVPDPVYDCTLQSLELYDADISPKFSKDVLEYSASVPSSVNSVEVSAIPSDENASVKVNRKTLGKIGSTTDINITVTAADKKSKLVYTISVKRSEKDSSSSASAYNSNTSGSSKTNNSSSRYSDYDNNKNSNLDPSKQVIKNVNNQASDLVLKNNTLPAFVVGILSILVPIAGYLIYIYKIKPKDK